MWKNKTGSAYGSGIMDLELLWILVLQKLSVDLKKHVNQKYHQSYCDLWPLWQQSKQNHLEAPPLYPMTSCWASSTVLSRPSWAIERSHWPTEITWHSCITFWNGKGTVMWLHSHYLSLKVVCLFIAVCCLLTPVDKCLWGYFKSGQKKQSCSL